MTQTSPQIVNGHMAALLGKIREKRALVGVVGLGYVGLPFAVEKARVGFPVVGLDRSAPRVASVNRGESYIPDVSSEDLFAAINGGLLTAVSDFSVVAELDVIVIAVPTPLTRNLTPDLSHVEAVVREIAFRMRPGQLITLESTTYPGTTDDVIRPMLEANGLVQGRDFFLAHSPERVDPGNRRYTTKNTNKVVGASDPDSLAVAAAFYQATIDHVVTVGSAQAAEMVKVYENTFRAVNIALANELAMLCDRMGLDVWEVLDAVNTKPFGIMPFYPGPGVGGHCIPLDPHYLEWKAHEFNFNTRFIALAGEINRHMPEFVREKTLRALNQAGIAPSKATVVALGVAYKKDLDDCRESPALEVMHLLARDGVTIRYHDPFVPRIETEAGALESEPLTEALLESADLVVILTDHSAIDYGWVVRHASAVLDTRNATRETRGTQAHVHML